MATSESRRRTYTGCGGQMAVMAELLERQCNVAVPEVDAGTDVFTFRDDRDEVARVQVKTGHGEFYARKDGYAAQFKIPLKQLAHPDNPRLFYALVTRVGDRYVDFLIIRRRELQDYWKGDRRFGTEDKQKNEAVLTVQFRERVICGEVDLTRHRNDWNTLVAFVDPPAGADSATDAVTPRATDATDGTAGGGPQAPQT